MREIERKFLVNSDAYKAEAQEQIAMRQGFLNRDPERTVRVRVGNGKGKITVKGISDKAGMSRFEWEKEIPENEALLLLDLCENEIIDKTRYLVAAGSHTIEVDEFSGANEGLVIAEIELNHPEETYPKPSWLGQEVTGDPKYFNAQLSKKPFKNWK